MSLRTRYPVRADLVLARLVVGVVATGLLATAAASATPAPEEERYRITSVSTPQNPNEDLVLGLVAGLGASDGSDPEPGTVLTLRASSCGRLLQEASAVLSEKTSGVVVWFTPDGEPSASPNWLNRSVGPSVEYVLTVTQGDYEPYSLEGSYSGYGVPRPSCADLDEQLSRCEIDRWGRKRSNSRFVLRPRVGSLVGVSRTVSDCEVSHVWTAAGQVVGSDRALRVPDSSRGSRLRLVVPARPWEGDRILTRTIRYGVVS